MVNRLVTRLQNTSLKNKIFFTTTLVILLISALIAVFTRWILISSLRSELIQRGLGIANSVAESGRGFLLTKDIAQLTSIAFDARLGQRRLLVNYIFIQDKQKNILAHTFVHPVPASLQWINPLEGDQPYRIALQRLEGDDVYDIAVPVQEGIYQIGSVHVGLYKKHIDQLIAKLRTTFLGFVSVVTLFCFLISHRLTRYITRPIAQLIRISDDLSRGNFKAHEDLGHQLERQKPTNDEVYRLAQSFRNMTQTIIQSQASLRDSEQKYRSMFASGPNPIFVIDRMTFAILDANPTAEDTYGYQRDELIGQPFTLLGHFDFMPHAAVGGRKESAAFETVIVSARERFFRKGQIPLYVNVQACPVRYAGYEALIVATTDITEMVEKDNQLIQFSKLKTLGEMSAGIAHELNQPLNAIKMGSEYLEMVIENQQTMSSEDLQTVTVEISRQVDRASDIIKRLRDFGRKSDFTRDKVSLNQPINSVLNIIGRQLSLQNIALKLELANDPPMVLVHPNRLEQVIFNLVTNARDALIQKDETNPEPDRTIEIRTFHENGRAIVSVADNGIGIPQSMRKKIFEAFFTTKEMGEGMGLGLSISSGIVEDYGGKIEVVSDEGRGTTFKLSFPIAP
ncbi:MAG: histidine kinase [Desulfatitalea sp. BRH_c12]|nr:MAG: histidine kinase [Desulfatitalea sp. BRH_c12]